MNFGINHAISRLKRIITLGFALIVVRQLWVQVIDGPRLAASAYNPRAAMRSADRGEIVARDGTVLAISDRHGRTYPYGASLAHTVGYASARYGTSGLEAAFDHALSASVAPNDPITQFRAIFGGSRGDANVRGARVVTTIDVAVQNVLFDELRAHARGAGVVLDTRTGEVLALASVPSFDPGTLDAHFGAIRADTASPLLHRALDGLYPPGSTFKIVTAAGALESGTVSMETSFSDSGTLQIGRFTIHDNEGEATGLQDLRGAFELSSNVDFARIALQMGTERWYDYAHRWKFGESVHFVLPVQSDRLPPQTSVVPGELAQMGFGQGALLMTPMRMALVAATIATGGNEPRPYLVRALEDATGHSTTIARSEVLAQPISAQTADSVRDLMVAVVAHGTGRAAALPNVSVAGKTGTATNPAGKAHAWFVAFAPAEAPRVAVAIVIENAGYGGAVAAPIAGRVLAAALAHS